MQWPISPDNINFGFEISLFLRIFKISEKFLTTSPSISYTNTLSKFLAMAILEIIETNSST